MRATHNDDGIPPATLFGFFAETLDDLARRIAHVEAHAALMVAASSPDPERVIVLQDLDLIRQMTEDAARLAGAVRRHGSGRRGVLAADLRLAALRDRLLGAETGAATHAGRPGPEAIGQVELFPTDPATAAEGGAG